MGAVVRDGSSAELFPAPGATGANDFAAAAIPHTGPEAEFACAAKIGWAKGRFHSAFLDWKKPVFEAWEVELSSSSG